MAVGTSVSIIIRTHGDRMGLLKTALASLVEQTHEDLQIVVVEDGSNHAGPYVENLASATGRSLIFQSLPEVGKVKAGNAGLAAAGGNYLGFLDDDDQLLPDHVATLASVLDANPGVDAAYSQAWEVPTRPTSLAPLDASDAHRRRAGRDTFSKLALMFSNYLPIQSVLFRRTLYESCGGFDEQLADLEDWDLWLRYCADHDFLSVPSVTSLFRIPADRHGGVERARSHAGSLSTIRRKQKEMRLNLSGSDVVEEYNRLAGIILLGGRPVHWLARLRERLARFRGKPAP